MPDPIPAVVLMRIRHLAQDAQRRGQMLDPRAVLDIADRRKA
ncbi:hypothetical protein [Brachybacterium alimentarium]|nr:hypothetical protein [Brachybacterium alimentarium]